MRQASIIIARPHFEQLFLPDRQHHEEIPIGRFRSHSVSNRTQLLLFKFELHINSQFMPFWNTALLQLEEFRLGILSKAEIGLNLTRACMKIEPNQEDAGLENPFAQSGVVLDGPIEMFIGDECMTLGPKQCYFMFNYAPWMEDRVAFCEDPLCVGQASL